MNQGRQRCAHIGLHRVAQAHGLVGREVDDQPVRQGAPGLFRLGRAPASPGVCVATVHPPENARNVMINSGGRIAVERAVNATCAAPGNASS